MTIKTRHPHIASGQGLAAGTYYLDPQAVDPSPPAASEGLSSNSTYDVFQTVTGRDFRLLSLHIQLNGTATGPSIRILNSAGDIVDEKNSAQYADGAFTYGTRGIKVDGGAAIEIVGGTTFSWALTYEVV